MHLSIENPGPQRPLKRCLDESDCVSPLPTSFQHKTSKRSRPDYSLDKAKHAHKEVASKKRRIEDWLAKSCSSTISCPPRVEDVNPCAKLDPCRRTEQNRESGEQRPLLEVLRQMSRSQSQTQSLRQSLGGGSGSSWRATSHPNYRKIIRNNGIHIDYTGEQITPELRTFLDLNILQGRSARLPPEAIAEAEKTAVEIADGPEGNVYDFFDTSTLPIKHSNVGRGGNTPWYPDGLPRNEDYAHHLATPKADVHCGYPTDLRSTWEVKENTVIDHWAASRLTQPAKGNCFPFLVFELKSEAMGGTLWQAENQAAGSAACCVSAVRWLYQEAYPLEEPSVVDTISFSACVTHRHIVFHVHWYCAETERSYMSWITTFDTIRQVQQCNHMIQNILDHCLSTRQTKIRRALALLYPVPEHWNRARPISAINSQTVGEENEDSNDSSNKSRRLK